MCQITIKGNPIAQKRHRYKRPSSRIISYDPNSRDKQAFAMQLALAKPKQPFSVPIVLSVIFHMKRPKKHYRTGKFSNQLKKNSPTAYINKPDIDNLLKFVMDSGNKILWKDDSVIVGVMAKKKYSEDPRTEIEIWEGDLDECK